MLSTPASNALLKTLEEPPRPRRLRAGHHRPAEGAPHHPQPDPALRVPAARARNAWRSCSARCGETPTSIFPTRRWTWPSGAAGARPATRSPCSTRWPPPSRVEDDLPELDEVVEALAERDVGRALVAVAHLASAGYSPQQLAGDLVDHLRQGFLALVAPDLVAVSESEHAPSPSRPNGWAWPPWSGPWRCWARPRSTMRDAPDPRVTLEVALVRLAHPEVDDTPVRSWPASNGSSRRSRPRVLLRPRCHRLPPAPAHRPALPPPRLGRRSPSHPDARSGGGPAESAGRGDPTVSHRPDRQPPTHLQPPTHRQPQTHRQPPNRYRPPDTPKPPEADSQEVSRSRRVDGPVPDPRPVGPGVG